MSDIALEAPIAAVTVYPDRARITRRGQVSLSAGEHRLLLDNLPASLDSDSIRVSGTGPATVLGVDVHKRFPAQTPDPVTADLEQAVRDAQARQAEISDADAVAAETLAFLQKLAGRATRSYARALAAGDTDPAQLAGVADALADRQAAVRERRRALAEQAERAREEVDAAQRALDERRNRAYTIWHAIAVDLAAESDDTSLDIEVSYVVTGAFWHSVYDIRLVETSLRLTWYGMVVQQTGEDWPEGELLLSTARPSATATVPELNPWFLDRYRPAPPPQPAAMPRAMAASFGGPARAKAAPAAEEAMPFVETVATLEQGATAATYRPARPVAVPSDGTNHRATIASVDLAATLDYITAPVRAAEAHLRATVTNSSEHTLPVGRAAVFHGGDFVGSTNLDVWAPGEEVELALGVDDRIRVERELVRRGATKAVLGAARRRDVEHRIRITNHTPAPAKVTVLDQLPVSRDDGIVVREQRIDPQPAERTDLGVLTWVLELAPGATRDIHLGVRVEVARGVDVVGWRE